MQALDLVERNVGSGRVVRIGQEHQLGLLAHASQDGVDIGGEILLRRDHRLGAGAERGDRVDQEAVGGVDRLVAVGKIGARQQIEQIVGAGAAHDARRIEPEDRADRFAQFGGRTVRVVFQVLADRAIGGDGAGAGAQRRLVGGQLEDFGDAGRRALARDIGGDIEHAGARLRTVSGHFTSFQFIIRRDPHLIPPPFRGRMTVPYVLPPLERGRDGEGIARNKVAGQVFSAATV